MFIKITSINNKFYSLLLTLMYKYCYAASTHGIDAAYCYRRLGVAWSVFVLDTIVNHAKTSEPIEMPFALVSRVCPRNHVLDGVQIHRGKGHYWRTIWGCLAH